MVFKVLFLHGIMQNKKIISADFANMHKGLSKLLDITYLEAPHVLKNFPAFCNLTSAKTDSELRELEEKARESYYKKNGRKDTYEKTWYCTDYFGNYSPQVKDVKILGLEESLDFLLSECKRTNCDGLLGFSQGSLISTILTKKVLDDHKLGWKPKFCMLFSAPMPYSLTLNQFLTTGNKLEVPSLHILGKKDILVPNYRSLLLSECYKNPILHYHDGGHTVPHTDDLSVYEKFLSNIA